MTRSATLVCSHLDMDNGLEHYDEAMRLLSLHAQKISPDGEEGPEPLEHLTFTGYETRASIFSNSEAVTVRCPECKCDMKLSRWVNQGDRRYMSLAACREHGKYLVRLKFRRGDDGTWTANRIVYAADDEMQAHYKAKASQGRRRHGRRKKSPKESNA